MVSPSTITSVLSDDEKEKEDGAQELQQLVHESSGNKLVLPYSINSSWVFVVIDCKKSGAYIYDPTFQQDESFVVVQTQR